LVESRLFVLPLMTLGALLIPALTAFAQADPVAILEQFVDARNQADELGAMVLVGDEMIYVGGSECSLGNPCVGPQALRGDLRRFISEHTQSMLVGVPSLSGTTVTARMEVANDAVRAAGLDRVVYSYTVDVRDGKLTSLRAVQDASDPQTAAFVAYESTRGGSVPALAAQSRDRWYLEPRLVSTAPAMAPMHVADRWYLEPQQTSSGPLAGPHIADRWYLEPRQGSRAPASSAPVRDTWYLDK
jgi:hypothetical protein